MSIISVDFSKEAEDRYLTYALSVVNNRAIPDVRDGLKPVQRRILFAMYSHLHLTPEKNFRKSAAVVGEVLAKFHPHSDQACYEAMVRMAQDFSLRYPLIKGQGNFGSLDGDGAAAYRYTEAKLSKFALEVIGDIDHKTVDMRFNFDQTTDEPVVLPARVPNLLVNGSSGIAVGLATNIPPHNLSEVVEALKLILADPEVKDAELLKAIKGPDFPTGCSIVNTKAEIKEIYATGRGTIYMRGDYLVEDLSRGKRQLVITSIPYGVNKSQLVEKIAEQISNKKIQLINDIRDESTDDIRVVLNLVGDADPDVVMAFLYKHTQLESPFAVNLTALVPTDNPFATRPKTLSLKQVLLQFLNFRRDVTRSKLEFEKAELEKRIHLLEGLKIVLDALDEAIKIIRKSDGRKDAEEKLIKRFKLTETQASYIVELRLYQLSKTSVDQILEELTEKKKRVKEIVKILASEKLLLGLVDADLDRVVEEFGDKRKSKIITTSQEFEYDADSYIQHEDVSVLITRDGWVKRQKKGLSVDSARLREGDAVQFILEASTQDTLSVISSQGVVYGLKVLDLPQTSGFGDPIQKHAKFSDNERIAGIDLIKNEKISGEALVLTTRGLGMRVPRELMLGAKRGGKKLCKISEGDALTVYLPVEKNSLIFSLTSGAYGLLWKVEELPLVSGPAKGVITMKLPTEEQVVGALVVTKDAKVLAVKESGSTSQIDVKDLSLSSRAKRGHKLVRNGLPLIGLKQG
ncbi:DNA topoisomerase IV subunit A [bacterium]|nr:DNA topoisomerase IV subunit A [bacterium]